MTSTLGLKMRSSFLALIILVLTSCQLFAVDKEAVIKALGGEPGIEWHGIEVGKESSGKPVIWLHGETAKLALRAGAARPRR